ncbi:MAG: hypothetical protein HYZ29_03800 [Myxococcales bacterium]|nr:hypothetical protein [Myxococcales bacterium]
MKPTILTACAALCLACAGPPKAALPGPEVRPSPHPSAGTPSEQPPPRASKPKGRVRSGAVDDIVVGAPIPGHLLEGTPKYHARWIADAQPLEGFLFGDPPIWVTLESGPMKDVEPGPIEALEPKLAPKALAAARAGSPVGVVVIEHPGIVTDAGIGVGSSWDALEDAYGAVSVQRDPEEFDNKPSCAARAKALPGVVFLLESCPDGGPYGRVKRVVVGAP